MDTGISIQAAIPNPHDVENLANALHRLATASPFADVNHKALEVFEKMTSISGTTISNLNVTHDEHFHIAMDDVE